MKSKNKQKKQTKNQLIRLFRNTLESFSKLLQLFFGIPAFYFLSFFIML